MFFKKESKQSENKRIAEIDISKKEPKQKVIPSACELRDKIHCCMLKNVKSLFKEHKMNMKDYEKDLRNKIYETFNVSTYKGYLFEINLCINDYKYYYDFYLDVNEFSTYNYCISYQKLFISDLKKIDNRIAEELRQLGYYVKIEYNTNSNTNTKNFYGKHVKSKMIINTGNSKKLKGFVKTIIILNRIYKDIIERKYNPHDGSEFVNAKLRFEEQIS